MCNKIALTQALIGFLYLLVYLCIRLIVFQTLIKKTKDRDLKFGIHKPIAHLKTCQIFFERVTLKNCHVTDISVDLLDFLVLISFHFTPLFNFVTGPTISILFL